MRDLTVGYPDRARPVFTAFNLTVPAGERWAVTGASGAGKTTLILALAGLLPCASGEIQIGQLHVHGQSEAARSRLRNEVVGVVFQDFNLLPDLTVAENLRLRLAIAGKKKRLPEIDALLAGLGLLPLRDRPVRTLSGGQQQRLALARCLITDPSVVLADEPTGHLDDVSAQRMANALTSQSDRTILVATHDPRLLDRMHHICAFEDCCRGTDAYL